MMNFKLVAYGKRPEKDTVRPKTPIFINQNCNFASRKLCRKACEKDGTNK